MEVVAAGVWKPLSKGPHLARCNADDGRLRGIENRNAQDADRYGKPHEAVGSPIPQDANSGQRKPKEVAPAVTEKDSGGCEPPEVKRKKSEAATGGRKGQEHHEALARL